MPPVKNRVQELRWVKAGSLVADPRNWRSHPTAQRAALRAAIDRIGFSGALVARQQDDELILIDGHLRAEEADADQQVPVLVVDLDEDEAGLMLATYDPIGAMAEAEQELLADLLETMEAQGEEELAQLLVSPPVLTASPEALGPEPDPEPRPPPGEASEGEYVVVTFRIERDEYELKSGAIAEAVALIGIQPSIQNVR